MELRSEYLARNESGAHASESSFFAAVAIGPIGGANIALAVEHIVVMLPRAG